jgi:hypothetical protein
MASLYTAIQDPEDEQRHLTLGECLGALLQRLGACERQGADAEIEVLAEDTVPVVSVSVATDAVTGERTQRFFFTLPRGQRGERGVTPCLRINGESLEWEVSTDGGEGYTSLGVVAVGPAGAQGAPGERGADGERGERGERGRDFHIARIYESIAQMEADFQSTAVAKGELVAIRADVDSEVNAAVYVKGEDAFEFFLDLSGAQGIQGPRGAQGERGSDGKTPVCGVDYFTATDKAAMVAEVLAALPVAEEVSF